MPIGHFKLEQALPRANLTRLVDSVTSDDDLDDVMDQVNERAIRRDVRARSFKRTHDRSAD